MSPNAGGGGSCGGGGVSATEYSCAHGAQRNFGDLTPYLAYGSTIQRQLSSFANYDDSRQKVTYTEASKLDF